MGLIITYRVPVDILRKAGRHDERFFNRRDLELAATLSTASGLKPILLDGLLEFIGTGKGIAKEDQGFGEIAFLKVGNIEAYRINYGSTEVVSEEVAKRNKMDLLKPGDLLISRVGTVGTVTMYGEGNPPATPSDNILLLRLRKDTPVRPYYVCIFLNSPLGQAQIRRYTKQSLQEVINQTSIRSLVIPEIDTERQIEIERQVNHHLSQIDAWERQIEAERNAAAGSFGRITGAEKVRNQEAMSLETLMLSVENLTNQAAGNVRAKARSQKALEAFTHEE